MAKTNYAGRFAQLRDHLGLSKSDFATLAEIDRDTISEIENGTRLTVYKPTLDRFEKIEKREFKKQEIKKSKLENLKGFQSDPIPKTSSDHLSGKQITKFYSLTEDELGLQTFVAENFRFLSIKDMGKICEDIYRLLHNKDSKKSKEYNFIKNGGFKNKE